MATVLSSLVAGFLFAFAVVVMPGIKRLSDREFIRAFQVMDGVIQKGQPLFVLVWAGSVATVAVAAVLGLWSLDGADRLLLVVATTLYLLGAQLPTFMVNVPLNNQIQSLDPDGLDEPAQTSARRAFEPRWNRWNAIRTVMASLASALLILLMLRL
ncbi:anthrone oxygenase family protein [Thiocystis violacea]|uniref:anthrone oxygenase family protein n=1 Tax=Thiocystis violacea TaxID=13725 RepID=UPI001908FB41|nr:DUF1772 domain-containing protein [Thiocystis violacea]